MGDQRQPWHQLRARSSDYTNRVAFICGSRTDLGEACGALTCIDDAPAQFVAPAFALAVRPEKGDTVSGNELAWMGSADTPHPTA